MAEVPPPPSAADLLAARLDAPPFVLNAGVVVHHVYETKYPSTSFNPGAGHRKFDPFQGPSGSVPTYYCANAVSVSFTETVFRAMNHVPAKTVPARRLKSWSYAGMKMLRTVHLAKLKGNDLARLNVRRALLLETDETTYLATVQWARAIHAANPAFDGLLWVSHQQDDAESMLFFGDRVFPTDLQERNAIDLGTPGGLDFADRVGADMNVTIIR